MIHLPLLLSCQHEKSTLKLFLINQLFISSTLLYTVFTQSLDGQEVNGFDEEPNFEYVPVDASPASKARVRTGDRLYESMMLLAEGLETGAVTLQFDVSDHRNRCRPFVDSFPVPAVRISLLSFLHTAGTS